MEIVNVADGTWMLRFPVVQAYLMRMDAGFALVDTGPAGSESLVLDALRGVGAAPGDLREIVLTHCHHDHMGSAAAVAAATGARVLAGRADAPVIRGTMPEPTLAITDWERPLYERVVPLVPPAPPTRVDQELDAGDELAWSEPAHVLHVPGHTPGSIAVYLPSSRLLFTGDNVASWDGRPILGVFNADRAQAITSFRRLAELDVDIACFGHGNPILGSAGPALRAAAEQTRI